MSCDGYVAFLLMRVDADVTVNDGTALDEFGHERVAHQHGDVMSDPRVLHITDSP